MGRHETNIQSRASCRDRRLGAAGAGHTLLGPCGTFIIISIIIRRRATPREIVVCRAHAGALHGLHSVDAAQGELQLRLHVRLVRVSGQVRVRVSGQVRVRVIVRVRVRVRVRARVRLNSMSMCGARLITIIITIIIRRRGRRDAALGMVEYRGRQARRHTGALHGLHGLDSVDAAQGELQLQLHVSLVRVSGQGKGKWMWVG